MARPARDQLVFDLPVAPAQGREDLVVGKSNALAVELVDAWPDWPGSTVLLAGPPGSGKSHIARAWAEASGAQIIDGAQHAPAGEPSGNRFLVEDADRGALGENALFHLLNHVRAHSGHCLLTCRTWPLQWGVALPDLLSRLRAAPLVELREPDDILLRGVLFKLFADRQIEPRPGVIDFVVARMERSLETANRLVAAIDVEALALKSAVTRPLAAAVLERMTESSPSPQARFDFDMLPE